QDERHGFPRHSKQFHFLKRPWQSRFRTGRRKSNRQRFGHRVQKPPQRNPRQHRNRQQHAYHKKQQRRIHGRQQLQQRQHHSQPEMPDGVRYRSKHANGRHIHHQIRELEHRLRKASRKLQHWPPLRLRHQNQRHGK